MVLQAATGSGKTLAFLLTAAARLADSGHGLSSHSEGPRALCLAPTRELVLQTFREAKPLQRLFGLRAACVHGGVDKEQQRRILLKHPHVLIATPGRCALLRTSSQSSIT